MTSSCQHQLLTFFKSLKFPLLKCVAMASPSVRFCRSRPSSQALLSASMHVRYLQTSNQVLGFFSKKKKKKTDVEKQELIIVHKSVGFQQQEIKSRENFICLIENFEASNPTRRGHVEFIYACLRNMDDFGLEKDKEIYKKIMNIFPKEKMIPKNELQIEFMHFPWQQQCAVDVLCKMEDNGVIPDKDFQYILMQTFGYRSIPIRKFYRMMYWMPKFKHASPFPLPNPVPDDTLELAVLALKRITSVDAQTNVNVYQADSLEDSVDHTWVVSAQSATQKKLIQNHPTTQPLFVEGAYRVWLRNKSIAYFVLRANRIGPLPESSPDPDVVDDVSDIPVWAMNEDAAEKTSVVIKPSVHEQEDGTYLATSATGTSSRDSLLTWIRFLHQENPCLKDIPVIFTLRAPTTAVVPVNASGLLDKEEDHQLGEFIEN